MKKNKKIEIDAGKLKRKIQNELYEKIKNMTTQQKRIFYKKEAITVPLSEFWKRIQGKAPKKNVA